MIRVILVMLLGISVLSGQERKPPVEVGHVYTNMTVFAPGVGSNSETGIGALIPWANRLWAVGYVAHIQGDGIGLYEIFDDMTMRKHPASVTGTYANRLVHWETNSAIIGPHIIDPEGNVRTVTAIQKYRLADTMRHLTDPENKVYFLTMEGLLFEVDLHTLEARELFDLVRELDFPPGKPPHFKGGHTAQGRVIVAANRYWEEDFRGEVQGGRLAEWDGNTWTVLEKNPFVEVAGKENPSVGENYGNAVFATGWTRSSVLLRVLHRGEWRRYLLPKGSHSFDHAWNTEWMRIREAQTERYLMDIHGIFYDLPPMVYDDHVWGIRPVCSHLRIVPDFCFWRGLFVMAGDQTDNAVGQPQSGLWFGDIDDLWAYGKPQGWGGPWWETAVEADTYSDPFLLTGFDKKVVHIKNDSPHTVAFDLEVDITGNGMWVPYRTLKTGPNGYIYHVFPEGYSAHWIRAAADKDCVATLMFYFN